MANQNKLKAWVRYDGTNTVVTAGPIFRASKPKVGNWKQMNANLCCNGSTPTTTTTTTNGGGVTPTAYAIISSPNLQFVCAGIPGWVLYAAQSTLGAGVTLYYDVTLTQPWEGDQYISNQGIVYTLSGATIIDNGTPCGNITTTTTTTVNSFFFPAIASPYSSICGGSGTSVNLYSGTPNISIGSVFYTNAGLTNPYIGQNGEWIRINYYSANWRLFISQNGEVAVMEAC
jgi:hypothetical protein